MGDLFFGRENVPQEPVYAIGGVETHTANSSSSQSTGQQITSTIPQQAAVSSSTKAVKSYTNSNDLETFEYGSNPEVYQGYYTEEVSSSETPSIPSSNGFLMKITLFLYSIYKQVRGIVEPVFAQVVSIDLLS
jgi:hypothetical protein